MRYAKRILLTGAVLYWVANTTALAAGPPAKSKPSAPHQAATHHTTAHAAPVHQATHHTLMGPHANAHVTHAHHAGAPIQPHTGPKPAGYHPPGGPGHHSGPPGHPGTHPGPKSWHPEHPPTVRCPPSAGGHHCATAHYAAQYGLRTAGGCYVYRGMGHQHWTCRHYSPAHRCWCWYDPCTTGWYYWCGERGYYLPVRYITVLVPTVTVEAAAPADLPPCAGDVPVAAGPQIPDLPELNDPQ